VRERWRDSRGFNTLFSVCLENGKCALQQRIDYAAISAGRSSAVDLQLE